MLISDKASSEKPLCVDDNGVSVSYADLNSFVESFVASVPEGRHLAFLLARNCVGSLISYLACLESQRIVPLILDADLSQEVLNNLVDCYKPALLMGPSGHFALNETQLLMRYYGYELGLTDAGPCAMDSNLALLLATSGSTGDSKLVRLSYNNILANAQSIAQYLEIDSEERPITSLPMNYTYGLSVINSHVLMGATVLVTGESVLQRGFWDFFKNQNATSLAGVPYTYQMLKRLRFFSLDLPSLTTLTQAGGRLGPELHEEYARWASETGRRFFVMYGQTEATARMSYLPWERSLEKVGSIGIAIPGGVFRLMDEGREVEGSGKEGELVYVGPNVSLGYARNRDDLAKGDERGGVLHTGDLARRDEDGYYYITGRASRFLKIFGKRMNLVACEDLVERHFDCSCVCAGHDDLLAVFVTSEGIEDAVRSYVASTLGVHASAVKVRFLPEIPRNSSGKVLYSALPLD